MTTKMNKLVAEIKGLPEIEKLQLIAEILSEIEAPNAEIDRAWLEEVRKRWAAYKLGGISTESYNEVVARHRP